MNRTEYMKQLAYLLQDLPQQEAAEILNYYEDYFDDGGKEQEENIIRMLGSPERLAAMIKDGMAEGEDGAHAEYTDSGYRDERFNEHAKMPQPYQDEDGAQEKKAAGSLEDGQQMSGRNRLLAAIVVIVALCAMGTWTPLVLVLMIVILYFYFRKKRGEN